MNRRLALSPVSPSKPKREESETQLGLTWFEVENFKSIRKLRLDFQPLQIFVGPNGAGKTNIIQSLALYLDILQEGSTDPSSFTEGSIR